MVEGGQPTGNLTFSGFQISISPPLDLHYESNSHHPSPPPHEDRIPCNLISMNYGHSQHFIAALSISREWLLGDKIINGSYLFSMVGNLTHILYLPKIPANCFTYHLQQQKMCKSARICHHQEGLMSVCL